MAPPGITLEYKQSAEYKAWAAAIWAEAPHLPEYLVDMAIAFHKMDPKLYRKKFPATVKRDPPKDGEHTLHTVKIVNSIDELPPLKYPTTSDAQINVEA